jgi:hypothetical protein
MAWAQTLATTPYQDPRGYFMITPPTGWAVEDYPDDPRGKVAFTGPHQVHLRVLVNAVDFDSLDSMIVQFQSKERELGISTNIERTTFNGMAAVRRSFTVRGMKCFYLDFLVERISYNLGYDAPEQVFPTYYDVAMRSMATILPKGWTAASAAEVAQHRDAKEERISDLMARQGWTSAREATHGPSVFPEGTQAGAGASPAPGARSQNPGEQPLSEPVTTGAEVRPPQDGAESETSYGAVILFLIVTALGGSGWALWTVRRRNLAMQKNPRLRPPQPPKWVPRWLRRLMGWPLEDRPEQDEPQYSVPEFIDVKCTQCGKQLRIPGRYAGQTGRCRGCGGKIQVPDLRRPLPTDPWEALGTTHQEHLDYLASVKIDPDKPMPVVLRFEEEAPSAASPRATRSADYGEMPMALGCLGLIISAAIAGPFAPVVYVLFVGPILQAMHSRRR